MAWGIYLFQLVNKAPRSNFSYALVWASMAE